MGTSPPPSVPRDLVVRSVTTGDAATVADVYLRSWRAGYDGLVDADRLEPVARALAAYDWVGAIESFDGAGFGLGELAGEPVGIVKVGPDPTEPHDGTWVELLYVVPEAWGSGISAALLDWGVARARALGDRVVRLRVVEEQARARRFYEREGWRDDPSIPPGRNDFFALLCLRLEID
jgi:GNAT superfamily N-acetyltransferase